MSSTSFKMAASQSLTSTPDGCFQGAVVINTSVEHFDSHEWFDKLELGTLIAVQSNNMPHDDHVLTTNSVHTLRNQFPMSVVLSAGSKKFEYKDWSFTRFMVIGKK